MNISLSQFIFLLLLGALYLPVVFFALQRREGGHETATWLVMVYALLAMVINVTEAMWQGESNALVLQELQTYVALTLATVLVIALQTFLKRKTWWAWTAFWGFWMFSLALIVTNALNLPDTIWTNGSLALFRSRLGPAWAILGWLVVSITLIITLANVGRSARQPLFRNRLNYWWLVIFISMLGDILLFSGIQLIGQPLRLLVAITLAYVVGVHHVPDLRTILRHGLTYVVTAIVIVGFYVTGFLLMQALFGAGRNFNPLLAGAFIALLIAIIFSPLTTLISRVVNRWSGGDQYDPSLTIHQYSESISNILDMDKLANVAIGIMLEAMQIERGFLFLVDSEHKTDGNKAYKLRYAQSPEERQTVAIELEENGSIASYFIREQRPLLQYDLDLLPVFRTASPNEHDWFTNLRVEVYIPIFAKKRWIGLLAFGPKMSGNRYTREDLAVLSAHANQTAVALENARLVDNLMQLNNELRRARRALEKNNQELERIDQAKSDFISIASHELRTPLTIIKGYTEMLLENPKIDDDPRMMIKGIHEGALRLHEVMDSMFDIAQINASSLTPHLQPVDIGYLLQEVCQEQQKSVSEREQSLTVDLPPLPLIIADSNLLKKLFHHLIRNAIKFSPDQGKIAIAGKQIPAIINLPNGGVEIIISDSGVGVDPTLREVIFTKFFQPGELGKHSTSKTRFQGSGAGLGLALSKGIVEAHGGRIWVESPGYDEVNFPGSQFHVILPLSKQENGEPHKLSEEMRFEIGA